MALLSVWFVCFGFIYQQHPVSQSTNWYAAGSFEILSKEHELEMRIDEVDRNNTSRRDSEFKAIFGK